MPATRTLIQILMFGLLGAAFSAEATTPRVLRYTDHEPAGGMRTKLIQDVLFPAIERESKGRLKIAPHWNGEIATGQTALKILSEGRIADLGIVVPEYSVSELPLHQIFKSFPIGPTGAKQVAFFRQAYAEIPAFPAELKNNNLTSVYFATGFPVAFFSSRPMVSLGDVKGGKWRSASFWHQDALRNAGATPVSVPWGAETRRALEAKELDGVVVNVDSGFQLKVHDVAPHVLISQDLWLGHAYLLVMNTDVWNGLAREDQQAIQRAAEAAYKVVGAVMDSSFNAMVDDIRNSGAKIRLLDRTELARWETATKPREGQANWLKVGPGKAVPHAGLTLEQVRTLLNKY